MIFFEKGVMLGIVIFLALYYTVLKKVQWQSIFFVSLLLYVFLEKAIVFFSLISSLSVYVCARKMDSLRAGGGAELKRELKKWLKTGLFVNFGILFAFKYFFLFPKVTGLDLPGVALPLGISFYTFKITSYLIDVYRNKYPAEKNFFKLYGWMIYFPALLQGPIDKYDLHRQSFFEKKGFDVELFSRGLLLILFALFKKFVIADRIAIGVQNMMTNYPSYSGAVIFLGLFAFGIQIYADFSGGIDLVRGLSYLFGIRLGQNFNSPYLATSVAEYWRRWHMTLGAWMREYVFYPMSLSKTFAEMSRKSRQKFGAKYGKIFALLVSTIVVYFLIGIWHGSGMTSVLFGLFHGTVISLSILLQDLRRRLRERIALPGFVYFVLQLFWVNLIITFGRFFSKADTLSDLWRLISHTFTHFWDSNFLQHFYSAMNVTKMNYLVVGLGILVLIAVAYQRERYKDVYRKMASLPLPVLIPLLSGVILMVYVFGIGDGDLSSVEFVYMRY